ncbi:MAG: MFS transporter [Candidatus Omnitrophica bacterium]|nr:MFS transporter [Candidatus Omnitrophota bacterium]MBU1929426.1 MFS transporter [Candidatus Omnitrophota bacterium]
MFLSSIITLAWLVKPLFGYIIDRFLNKKAWIFISLGLDIALVLVLFVFPLPVAPLIALLLFNSANSALRDVGVDGIMCVEGKKYALTGKIQSIQWISISVAILITGIGGGYIAHKWGFRSAFLFLIPFYLLAGVITNFYSEDKSAARNSGKTLISDLKRLFAHKQLMIVALFIFLYKYSPSFGTPLFFIQRDSFKWGKVWIGALSSIGTVFTIFGALLYYKFSKKINIRKWLYISVFLGAATTLSFLYYTPVTAVIYDVVYSFIGMFIFLMVMDFMARNTIPGLEATSFAFLCSVSNLALTTSNLSGAILFPVLGLPWLIVLSALTSFLCLFLINKIF